MQHVYHDTTGVLVEVRECVTLGGDNDGDGTADCTGSQVYWEATAVNIAGAVTMAKLGNDLTTQRSIDIASGHLRTITTTKADGTAVQSLAYEWDLAGNLTRRHDQLFNPNGGYVEDFEYDGLHRLTKSTANYNIDGIAPIVRTTHYAANGNIRCFNVLAGTPNADCTTDDYSYDPAHPHAVQTTPASATAYDYNANGSMISGPGGRTVDWTAFNKPKRIAGNGAWAEFSYDANRARYKQATASQTTYYIGSLYERVIDTATGNATHRFHIFAGGSAVAVYSCTTSCGTDPNGNAADGTRDETLYLHRDHLGSVTVITDGHGTERERFTYTAWGGQQRWDPNSGTAGEFIAASSDLQTRGFTGHEMLDELGLIHMNGRIYDQNLGRFLSADPFVQFPHSTQGYNRYTYVGNNPLTFTDPSGYFSLKRFVFGGILGAINPEAYGRVLGVLGPLASLACGPAVIVCAAATGAVSGYLQGGKEAIGKSMVMAAASAGLAYAIGGAAEIGGWNRFTTAIVHGVSQGGLSDAGGGRFSDGFLGGFSGHMSSGLNLSSNPVLSTIQAAIIGGTVAEIGGGNFGNGAMTAAFVHAFNALAHPDDVSQPKLDASVCSQKGFECKALPIQENLEKVASDKVILGVQRSGNVSTAEILADGLSLATPASATVRIETTVMEVSVDLYRVREVGVVIVTHEGNYYDSFKYRNKLTNSYIEVASGMPYTRPAGFIEAPMTSFTSYPTRVNWSAHVGYQIPESNIQRRSW